MVARTATAILLTWTIGAHADICRWTDAAGVVHYADRAPADVAAQCKPSPAPPRQWEPKTPLERAAENAEVDAMVRRAQRDLNDLRRSLAPGSDAQRRFEATLLRARLNKALNTGQ